MKAITLLGATGSIGTSTLDVLSRHPEKFSLYAACAQRNVEKMLEIILKFKPKKVALSNEQAALVLKDKVLSLHLDVEILRGESGVIELAADPKADIVVGAIVGAAGLKPLLAAVKNGGTIALANKEALVMSGRLFFDEVRKYGARVLPVDSEHSAIFQSLPYAIQTNLGYCNLKEHKVDKILLTGSGGPFRNKKLEELCHVTAKQAVAHPVWSMGPKISVDSATMMNKGLEFIEARYLFNATDADIKVVIHPQSVIHSMVSYIDGAVMAQLGKPDMRTPIAVALGFPDRIHSGVGALDFASLGELTFKDPDYERYPCLKLAMQSSEKGQAATVALNAANEIAVAAFLEDRLRYLDISQVVSSVLDKTNICEYSSIDEILEADKVARELADSIIRSHE